MTPGPAAPPDGEPLPFSSETIAEAEREVRRAIGCGLGYDGAAKAVLGSPGVRREVRRWAAESVAEQARLITENARLAAALADAQGKIAAVETLCDRHEHAATRWEHPLPVPAWIGEARAALAGDGEPEPGEETT